MGRIPSIPTTASAPGTPSVPFEVGEADVDTAPGQGSTFWLSVRLNKGETGQGGHTAPGPSEAGAILKRDHAGARILLAEDEPVNREITLSRLDDVGLVIDIAEYGAQALKLAETNEYALILMDMQMPNMDGLEATRRIRRLPARRNVPIVAMTANAFAEDKQRCIEAGMDDFISKPMSPETLFATMLQWLRKRGYDKPGSTSQEPGSPSSSC